VFQDILREEVEGIIPYIFQVLAVMMEQQKGAIPEPYFQLLPFILMPALWERQGYVGPSVRLLQAFIEKSPERIIQGEKLKPILGLFTEKLNKSRAHDHEGFYLLQTLLLHMPPQTMDALWRQIFTILFRRLTNNKTTKYMKCLIIFFSVFLLKHSVQALINLVEVLQPGMFNMVLGRIIVPELCKIGQSERRLVCVAWITVLVEPSVYVGRAEQWSQVLESLVKTVEHTQDSNAATEELFSTSDDGPLGSGGSNKLMHATKMLPDMTEGQVGSLKQFLCSSLCSLSSSQPGMNQRLAALTAEPRTMLATWLQQAGAAIQ